MAKTISEIDWLKLLKVDSKEFSSWFRLVDKKIVSGAKINFYCLNFNKTKPDYEGFIRYLLTQVESYVFEKFEILEILEDGESPQEKALSYFGNTDPLRDGRYGELILYLFVEALLKAPLVVHKIGQTYNNNDQVKGSDGLFLGSRAGKSTLFLGESKMRGSFSVCVSDALDSISRYIDNPDSIDRELSVAKKHLSRDLNNLDKDSLDLIYRSLRTKQPEFKQYSICYPAFLMYKEGKIEKMIDDNLPDIENEINKFLLKIKDRRAKYIGEALPKTKNITLEFFMMPVVCVNSFRELCYKVFHNDKIFQRVN
ncbi:HamA C-terminal domain-containing protein [Maribacter luteus]|uniref:DUF1837 domain-containing protein n=1 Tax=Maribacter luteus TaxID=2594478 RepID=A0A6I2MLQ4_9FLAO|nr:DUF1837 domain-containing protein [Maribacter luteus]MRX64763.1 DUF1837 domain-containing protein [Maribacter luteus]